MARIYKAHGEMINIEPKNGTDFSLEEMQAIVSGYIEIVYLQNEKIMVLNEEGKLKGLAINHEATRIFRKSYPYTNDVIVGDVLVCNETEVKQKL